MTIISDLSNIHTSEDATILTRNLLYEIDQVANKFEPQDIRWADEILTVLKFVVAAGEGITIGVAYTLFWIKKNWDDLPLQFRLKYANQFSILVVTETNIRVETLENYFRAIKTFLVDQKRPFGSVDVIKRDKYGKEVVIDGEIVTESVEFDPVTIPISKLTLMRSAVENDRMNDKRWSMLADPHVTVAELQQELYVRESSNDPDPSLRFYLAGNIIIASEMGSEYPVGALDFAEYGDNELVTNAIKRIAKCLGLKLNEVEIDDIKHHGFVERLSDGSSKTEGES